MFNGLKRKLASSFITSFLKSLVKDKNTATTIVGILAGVIIAIPHLNWDRLLAGDPMQIAVLASGLAVWGIGQLATKENHDGHTTLLGVIAGAAQAYVGDFTSALTIALCGYFTNKPTVASAAKPNLQR